MSGEAKPPLSGDELQAMLDNSPFIAFLGLKVTEADPLKLPPAKASFTCSSAISPPAIWPRKATSAMRILA